MKRSSRPPREWFDTNTQRTRLQVEALTGDNEAALRTYSRQSACREATTVSSYKCTRLSVQARRPRSAQAIIRGLRLAFPQSLVDRSTAMNSAAGTPVIHRRRHCGEMVGQGLGSEAHRCTFPIRLSRQILKLPLSPRQSTRGQHQLAARHLFR